ncbi:hypothetical protein LNM82_27085, partial [Klebsiella pneumoniae]|nr:hypothetical protein [Klebsiella pneumoniae]
MSTTVKPSADAAAIHNTREAVRSQPGLGNLTFQMKARSSGGLTVRTETGATIQNGVIDTSRVGKFSNRHCCKVSDEAAFCLIQRPYISKTLL